MNFPLVDIVKFVFAILIFIMHSGVFQNILKGELIEALSARLAVPYFFVASGFFFGKKVYLDKKYGKISYSKLYQERGGYLSRLLEKLIVFETISICFQSILEYISGESIRRIIFKDLRSIIFYPYGAMWYIQALIIALIIITVLINNKKELSALPFAFFFYGVLLICNRYFFLVEGTPLETLIKKVLYYTFSLRNGFTVGFLFTLIGVLIAKNYSSIQNLFNINISKLILLLFGCFLLLILEFSFTEGRLMVDDKGMYVSFILIIPILFALNLKNDWNRRIRNPDNYIILRNISTTLYLIHSPIILIIKIAEKLFFGNEVVFGSIWIIEFLVESVIICCTIFIIYKCKRLRFYRICT